MRRIVALATLLVVADAFASFADAMLRPSNVGLGVRVVEWLRDNGAAGLVSDVEALYYSLNAPSTGGAALRALPRGGSAARAVSPGRYAPPPIPPAIEPALPGEGVWHGTGPLVAGAPPVLVTTFRPDPLYPQMVAGVAWIDTSRTSLALYPGRYEPPNSGNAPAEVPVRRGGRPARHLQRGLQARGLGRRVRRRTGEMYAPLRDGQATLDRLPGREGRRPHVDGRSGPGRGRRCRSPARTCR